MDAIQIEGGDIGFNVPFQVLQQEACLAVSPLPLLHCAVHRPHILQELLKLLPLLSSLDVLCAQTQEGDLHAVL